MATEAPTAPVNIPQEISILGTQDQHKSMTFNLGAALDNIATREKVKPTMREAPKVPENPDQLLKPEVAKVEPEKPAVEAPEVVAEPTEDTPPAQLNEKEKVAWAKYRKIEKDYNKEVPELRQQLEALQKQLQEKDGSLSEFEKHKSRVKELEDYQSQTENELFLTRVQATRKYKDHVAAPMADIQSQVDEFAKTNSLDSSTIMDLLVRGDENALEEWASELSTWKQRKIEGWYGDIETIERAKSDIESNSKAAYEKAMEDEKRQWGEMTQKQQEARSNAIKTVTPKLGDTLNSMLPEDKRFDMDKISRELGNYDQWPEDYRIMGAAAAAFVPAMVEEWKAERESSQATIEQLKTENTKLRGGSAKVGGGATPSATEQPKTKENLTKVKEGDWLKGMASRVSASRF